MEFRPTAEVIELEDSPEAVNAYFLERRWSDGLPIVPPTPERVAAMLQGIRGEPDEVLGRIPPAWHEATLEKLAVNAVMAGCLPEYFPVIVAAVEAMLDPAFNLYGVQATTHPVAPLLIVNGPIVQAIGMNAGAGVFGPGWRPNATIGRAIRLILMNLGGAWPGAGDMATQGQPSKYTYCIAENEAESPWAPLHVEHGLDPAQSAVTVFGGENPHNVNDHVSRTASGILTVVADTMATLGSNVKWYFSQSQVLAALGPEHAATIARSGLAKADAKAFLWEHARLPFGKLKLGGMWGIHDWPDWMNATADDDALLPIVPAPEEILVIVAGGPGKHSAVIPNCTFSRAVTRPITRLPA